ncbi:MAG: trypsin-like peptidase domain-containing protein [Oscillospiraceae bacterium]|nr:trypsin-like peptidase domain-containing protein [Oscillospiraceae bacterium]
MDDFINSPNAFENEQSGDMTQETAPDTAPDTAQAVTDEQGETGLPESSAAQEIPPSGEEPAPEATAGFSQEGQGGAPDDHGQQAAPSQVPPSPQPFGSSSDPYSGFRNENGNLFDEKDMRSDDEKAGFIPPPPRVNAPQYGHPPYAPMQGQYGYPGNDLLYTQQPFGSPYGSLYSTPYGQPYQPYQPVSPYGQGYAPRMTPAVPPQMQGMNTQPPVMPEISAPKTDTPSGNGGEAPGSAADVSRGTPNEGAPDEGISRSTAPENSVPQNGAPQNMAPQYGANQYGAPQYGAPQNMAPQYGANQYSAPQYGAPQNMAPQYGTNQYGAPQYGAFPYGTPGYTAYRNPPPPPVIPAVDKTEEKGKKKASPLLLGLLAFIVLASIATVLILIAFSDETAVDSAGGSTSSSDTVSDTGSDTADRDNTQNVVVNIEAVERTADDEDYADKEKGLFTVTGAVKYIEPSVVTVYIYSDDTAVVPYVQGSGIILSEDGYISTNAHVLENSGNATVVLSDGNEYKARIIGVDEHTDLGVLKIDKEGLTPAVIGKSSDLSHGETIISYGTADGYVGTATVGCVSAVSREIQTYAGYNVECIQTDAALNEGQSGGPVIDLYGRVVGIIVSKRSEGDIENLGFAISTDVARDVWADLIEKGYVSGRTRIGVMCRVIDEKTAAQLGIKPGLLVSEVNEDCDIANTELKPDDIIVSIEDINMTSDDAVKRMQEKYAPGDRVKAHIYRPATVENGLEEPEEFDIEFDLAEFKD